MKNLILIAFAVILFVGCKKDAAPAASIVGKWQLIKETTDYYENGIKTDPPAYTGPIPVDDTLNIAFNAIQFNTDKTGTENYTVAKVPITYTLSNNQLSINCPLYSYPVFNKNYPGGIDYFIDLGFSGTYDVTVTKVSLKLFTGDTVMIDTNKRITVNRTMYFSSVQ